jgi:hypothetical protein
MTASMDLALQGDIAMFMKPLIAVLATAALATGLARHLHRKQQRIRDDRQRQRDDVKRWEAEGGNLPTKPQR